jgi:hypothetical protein
MIFTGSKNGHAYYSTTNGTSWTDISAGLPSAAIKSFALNGSSLFAATDSDGIYKLAVLPLGTVSIDHTLTEVQVYPNPLPAGERLTIESNRTFGDAEVQLFDVEGRKILSATMSRLMALDLNTSTFSRGIYFLKIEGPEISFRQKILIH